MTNYDVLYNWASRKVNKRCGDCSWNVRNVFTRDMIAYSYGHHFPLAVFLGVENGDKYFLLNNDSYSRTTSSHQSYVRSAISSVKGISISIGREMFNAFLNKLNYRNLFEHLTIEDIGDFNVLDPNTNWETREINPSFVIFKIREGDKNALFVRYGSVEFMTSISKKYKTIKTIWNKLVPLEIRLKEKFAEIPNQGIYYFIPTGMNDKDMAKYMEITQSKLKNNSKQSILTTKSISGYNIKHRAIWFGMNDLSKSIAESTNTDFIPPYAKGSVYRVSNLSNWNKLNSLKLGSEWHKVVQLDFNSIQN